MAENGGRITEKDVWAFIRSPADGDDLESDNQFSLSRFSTLDRHEAEILWHCTDRDLDLSGLKAIDLEVARELANYTGVLVLDGLESLTAELAGALAASKTHTHLSLNGLRELDVDLARDLAQVRASLSLNGLPHLSTEVARALLQGNSAPRHLAGIQHLNLQLAAVLCRYPRRYLNLSGVKKFDLDAAEIFQFYTQLDDSAEREFRRYSNKYRRGLRDIWSSASLEDDLNCLELSPELEQDPELVSILVRCRASFRF